MDEYNQLITAAKRRLPKDNDLLAAFGIHHTHLLGSHMCGIRFIEWDVGATSWVLYLWKHTFVLWEG